MFIDLLLSAWSSGTRVNWFVGVNHILTGQGMAEQDLHLMVWRQSGELICIQCQRLRFLHNMCCKEFLSMKKIEILLLIDLNMERFLKVALELLKQFFIVIMKLESSFIKFLLNQASGYHLVQQISRVSDRTEWSTGVFGSRIWSKIWRLHLPKKKS